MVVSGRLLAVLTLVLCTISSGAQVPDSTFWVPNGEVNALLLHDTTVIIGGTFDQVSPLSGSFVRVDTSTALRDPSLFKTNGAVYAMCRDSSGYIYVGGSFTRVGNTAVEHLFRLTPAGVYDPTFDYPVDGPVYSLFYFDSTLYIGGDFNTVNGEARSNCASVDLDTGGVNLFNPNVDGPVYCMVADTFFHCIVIGGDFVTVGTFNPPFLAKVDMTSGDCYTFSSVPWSASPNTDGPVYDMELVYNRLYIAGQFSSFANYYRRGLAKLDIWNGNLVSADLQINGPVYAIEVVDTLIYFGGSFTTVTASARMNLACMNLQMTSLQPWNPDVNGVVRAIKTIDSAHFFIGGTFTLANNDTCYRGAIVNYIDSGSVNPWNPLFNGVVFTAETDTLGRLYVGGSFFGMGGEIRKNLCALSVNTGKATAWNPFVNAAVQTMALDGDSLYFTGDFTAVNSITRGRTAAIDLNTEALLAFNPGVNGLVRTIAITDSAVYMGGNFTLLGGLPRQNIGKVNKFNSLTTTWNPGCLGTVNTIIPTDNWIYVAGYYNTIAGVTRANMARLNPRTGIADWNWQCDTDDGVYHAEFYNGKMVIGGWFDVVNGIPSPDFAFIDTTTLQVTAPAFNCDGFVTTFTNYGDDFFVAGVFDLVNNQYQPRLVGYDEGNNSIDPWTPYPNSPPASMAATATRIYVGGAMLTSVGALHPFLQVLNIQWVTTLDEASGDNSEFEVYPVPAANEITVSGYAAKNYTITDVTGKIVQAGAIDMSDGTETIDISSLAPGMYILTLAGENVWPVSQQIIRN